MADKNPIRVLIVDDQPVVRQGLATFLLNFDDMECIGEAGDGQQAIDLCQSQNPDIVLMDLKMPEVDGVTATRTILERCPNTRVVVLTSFPDDDLVHQALAAGASGYLLKNVAAAQLAEAIRSVYEGRSALAPEATEALIRYSTRPPIIGHDLTERELEVLSLMVEGMTNRQIADQLVVSPVTAKFHVGNILSKLGAQSRSEAVAIAVRHDLTAKLS